MSKKQSIEEIYQQNRNWIYGSFLKKVGHIETAEDLSQTLWLKFFQNYENLNLKHEKVLRTYLRSMVLHAIADYYRSLQRSADLMQELENLLAENSGHKDAVHDEAFPEDPMNDIETIYKELNDEERLLIYLKYGCLYNSKEISELIGISPSLVRMRLSRIIEKMRKQIKSKADRERK